MVNYWVRAEVFEHGVMPLGVPQSFTLAGLFKVPAAARTATHIRFGEWLTAAQQHLGLTEQLAGTMFDTFLGLCFASPQEQLDATREELAVRQDGRFEVWSRDRKVPLSPFLCFLFCQQYNRAPSLTGALTQPEAAWPGSGLGSPGGRSSSPTHGRSPARDAALRAHANEQEQITSFVNQHLYHLLALLAPNKYKVNFFQFEELRYILAEGDAHFQEVPFGSQVPWWQKGDKQHAVEISNLQHFVSEALSNAPKVYPPGELPPARGPQQRVLWPGQPDAPPQSRVALVRGFHKAMFHKSGSAFPGQVTTVQIYCCHQANIYLLCPLRNVAIFGCTNTNVVLGAVRGAVTIEHCEKVRVVCCSRQLRIQETQDSRVFACVNTKVHAFGGNRHVEIAPYNACYPALEEHLSVAGVNPCLNLWNEISHLCKEAVAPTRMVDLLAPAHFSSIAIPFTNQAGRTQVNPCAMPPEYTQELKRKVSAASKACAVLRAAAQDEESKEELARALNERFKHWLQSSGNLRHVLELLHYHEDD